MMLITKNNVLTWRVFKGVRKDSFAHVSIPALLNQLGQVL